VPPELRGTYAGLAHVAALDYLVGLGVTTVELLPVHHNVPESFLVERGLTNYWGYNTIGFFAPHAAYSAAVRAGRRGGQVAEFRSMVDALHAAGVEVVLDVVFNHTAEAGPAARRCLTAASTTPPTTASTRATRVATSTRQGRATR
jgi:isoamylase